MGRLQIGRSNGGENRHVSQGARVHSRHTPTATIFLGLSHHQNAGTALHTRKKNCCMSHNGTLLSNAFSKTGPIVVTLEHIRVYAVERRVMSNTKNQQLLNEIPSHWDMDILNDCFCFSVCPEALIVRILMLPVFFSYTGIVLAH